MTQDMGSDEKLMDAPPDATMVHHPYGFVRLEEWCGTELDIVNAARVSYSRMSDWDEDAISTVISHRYSLKDADAGLINYLMKHHHGTPFEMVWTKWHVKAPIFLFREWHRHRIASINEMSGRYVELKPEFYLPDDEHVRVQVGRPGHYTYEPMGAKRLVESRDENWDVKATYGGVTRLALLTAYNKAYEQYEAMLGLGIAKEVARACLPVAIYSEMYWATNLRGLLNFLSLRNHGRAMRELRDYAEAMERQLEAKMPVVHRAFVENGRVAP